MLPCLIRALIKFKLKINVIVGQDGFSEIFSAIGGWGNTKTVPTSMKQMIYTGDLYGIKLLSYIFGILNKISLKYKGGKNRYFRCLSEKKQSIGNGFMCKKFLEKSGG